MSYAEREQGIRGTHRLYAEGLRDGRDMYRHFPRMVSIETLVKCNAACTFCPYPVSPRQGQRLGDDLFYKIIDDLTVIPVAHHFYITLARINEPLLDGRLEAFSRHINIALAGATQIFWSNGSTLVRGKFEWMTEVRQATLVISLNSIDEQTHIDLMGFGLEKVFRNLDYLHELKKNTLFRPYVVLNSPDQSEAKSLEFRTFCQQRWPLFQPHVLPFFAWQGAVPAGKAERDASHDVGSAVSAASALGCGQWFDLHILANGQVTKCCIDESGFEDDEYSALNHNVLDLYGKSAGLRDAVPARGEVGACRGCMHLG
jgi:hypothetical protein